MINKRELIDVVGAAPGCRGRHIVVSGRMRALEFGIQPALSGKCPVQVNQVSITETMLDEAREECDRLEL